MTIRLCKSRVFGMNDMGLFKILATQLVVMILILKLIEITIKSKFDKSTYYLLNYKNKIFPLHLDVGSQIRSSVEVLQI
jgi:hypothetical protein